MPDAAPPIASRRSVKGDPPAYQTLPGMMDRLLLRAAEPSPPPAARPQPGRAARGIRDGLRGATVAGIHSIVRPARGGLH